MKFLTLSGAAKYWILLVTGIFTSSALMAQCINTQLGSNCTPGAFPSSGITLSASTGAANKLYSLNTGYNHLWATYLGGCYTVSSCGAANDTQIGLFSPTTGMASPFAYDDDNGPACIGTSASANFVSNYSGDITMTFRVYNCAVTVAATDVNIRQNNNLVITSSGASMCEGSMRALAATPAAQPVTIAGAGDKGTFSGTGVSGTTFTAPTPAGASDIYPVTYTFGYVSTPQNITVYRNPAGSIVTLPQSVMTPDIGLQAMATYGTGTWSADDPGVTFSPNAGDPNATAQNLVLGDNTLTWTVSNGPCSNVPYAITITRLPVLPLDLLSFSGNAQNGGIQLLWETANEVNVKHFEVESSSDATHFNRIATLAAQGNTSNRYLLFDQDFPQGNQVYYRLKMVDLDGSSRYSEVISVQNTGNQPTWEATIFPNPVACGKQLTLRLSECPESEIKISLWNTAGAKLTEASFNARNGAREYTLKLTEKLPAGIYRLRLSDEKSHAVFVTATIE